MNHQQQARKAFETELKGIGRRMEVGFALAGRRFEVGVIVLLVLNLAVWFEFLL